MVWELKSQSSRNSSCKIFEEFSKILIIYSVLDEDSSGDIDYRELITGLEYFKDSSVDEKLKGKEIFVTIKVNIF